MGALQPKPAAPKPSGRYGLGITDRLSLDGYDSAPGGLFGSSSIFTGESYEVAGGGSGLGLRDGSGIQTYAQPDYFADNGAPVPIPPPDTPEQRAYDLERLDYQRQFGLPADSYDQMLANHYGSGALVEGRASMRAFWGGLQDDAATSGSFLQYAGAGVMGWLGDRGYDAAEMGVAMYERPGSATWGAVKAATVNFGPDSFNALTNLTKTSLNGLSLLAESTFAPQGTFAGFRDSDPYNISLLAPYANQAESGGALLAGLGMGVGLAKYGGYNVQSPFVVGRGTLGSMGIEGFQNPLVAPSGPARLLPGEADVGTFRDLKYAGSKGDDITPHHIPSANHMAQYGISKWDGIAINMEQPSLGAGGRHRMTFTYGTNADIGLSARDALAAGIRDARQIYRQDGLYNSYVRQQLQAVSRENQLAFPGIFAKSPR